MENVKYVMLCWDEDLKNNSFVIFLSDTVRRNNGIVHSFLKKELGYGDKYFARADYRRKYPEAKIIDVM
jgi:hypothetical protein